jgi:RimJ/RimL family protein N-acetyltransferase
MTIREPICGELVCLGPLRVTTATDWVRWMEDPDTTRYLYAPGERPREAFTLSVALDWGRRVLADPHRLVFAITERATRRTVGDARLVPSGRRRARFSIVIGERSARGRGLGGEATALVCGYGFDQLGLEQIDLEVDPRNQAAVRAYMRVGFERTGRRTMRLTRQRWEQAPAAA